MPHLYSPSCSPRGMHLLPACVFSLFLSLLLLSSLSLAQLSPSFYAASCPSAVSTVTNTIVSLSKEDNVIAPSTLRLILHDCFVEGCDGSILLSSTSGNKAERDAADNANLPQNSFNAIIAAKKAVEQICPGVVSCADILALAARDVVVFLGGPSWEVSLGRLDGRVSTASSVAGRLPGADFDIKQLTDNFASVGLTVQDMVILSGAHTIGFSHCDQFKNRLYSFNASVKVDPSLDASFAQQLQKKCPAGGGNNLQEFDIVSPFSFDNNYFKDLQAGKGLLFSDQVLFQDASTRSTVESMAASQQAFFTSFTQAMLKMTSIGVKKTGDGEVRKECTAVNVGGGSAGGTSLLPPVQRAPVASPPSKPVTPPSSPLPGRPTPVVPVSPPPKTVPPTPVAVPNPVQRKPAPPPPQASSSPPPQPKQVFPSPEPEIVPPSPPPRRGGFTIPGIPGLTPPIHLPFPGFGGGGPPPGTGTGTGGGGRKAPEKNSRRRF